ncbi:MAG: protein-export chaperone SecB [Holosporales bacterium]|jgi:preprotein translocase subunit SecB|nr:protein-export chaperone SecB [Holosporales bacterium]
MADMKDQNAGAQYPFYIHDQYIKDLSFENPNFLIKYSENQTQPQVSVNVETGVAKLANNNYEASMTITTKSKIGEEAIFVLELVYASLVSVSPDLQQEVLESILLVHCPFLMFPFAREIVANVTKSGGYPPLLIEPVDFASLYLEKKKETSATVERKILQT